MSVEQFEAQRGRLIAIAYGILGSVMEAEDVVQEAWLRWASTDWERVDEPAAFLTTVVTRLAIDRLRSAARRRESYVGPWLPEPIVTDVESDPADRVAEAERISMALLTAMERLNPVERAVFLLREVFDYDYAEIAPIVGRSVGNCRQIGARARSRVGDPARARPLEGESDRAVVDGFLRALAAGDVDELVARLAADVVLWSDGGGKRRAARHPVHGADRVATFLLNVTRRGAREGGTARPVRANGGLALRLEMPDGIYGVMTFEFEEGVITAIRSVINPDKLGHVPGSVTDGSGSS
ncbi:MAG: RNA polymerase sigma-70 factor [Actinomycetota bacterium]